ncbi:pre-miRNA 5'-monophosphate methyltransferase [Entelurus aequoreus]|uniref:pre-miRNA 5'-monophosphate methyltransferase n=1 Tax=Entelurus aequoreus TaxID=161455 RepID=UPI002B1D78B8|nr:pre-miRNA 5'-monophosphate methyltransferase [Entelurus aequoreus]
MATCESGRDARNDLDRHNDLDEPGAALYGNFIHYYTFNPPENRLSLIPATLLADLGFMDGRHSTLLLDVGCNTGELSVALYKHLVQTPQSNVHLLGVDLDDALIQRATRSNPLPDSVTFTPLDITGDCAPLREHLRLRGCAHFHLTLCLAVTMWVHLNHGDAGLLRLLSRLAELSQLVLLEAQPWKCYRSAARRLRKLGRSDFEHFKELKMRGDMSEHARRHLVGTCDMELVRSFGRTAWDRKLLLFKRK